MSKVRENKKIFLVTAIGSFSSQCVIDSLQLNFRDSKIIGCDIYPAEWHGVSQRLNKVFQVPKVSHNESYLNEILEICLKEGVKFIIPLTDIEIDYFNSWREIFLKNKIILCMPSAEVIRITRNKFNLFNYFLKDSKVPSIKTFKSGVDQKIDLPAIGKPVNGRSSEGIFFAKNQSELEVLMKMDGYIIQEVLKGPVFTVDYVRSLQFDSDFSIARKELLRTKNGAGLTVEINQNSSLQILVSHIGRKLNINGCVNMEFIKYKDSYYLIDINPRFSAGVAFSQIAGYDMVNSHMNCFVGKDIIEPIVVKNLVATKMTTEVITKIRYE